MDEQIKRCADRVLLDPRALYMEQKRPSLRFNKLTLCQRNLLGLAGLGLLDDTSVVTKTSLQFSVLMLVRVTLVSE